MIEHTNFSIRVTVVMLFYGIIASKCLAQDVTSPRFFKFNIQNLSSPNRLITEEGNSLNVSDDETNYILETQLRFPIDLKGRTMFIGQVEYEREAVFGFFSSNDFEQEDFSFMNFSTAIIGIHKFNNRWSLFSRLKTQSGAERLTINGRSLNSNFSSFIQKKTENGLFGFGFQVSHNQRVSILPVIQYQRNLGYGWGVDISLPQQILVNKRVSESNLWYAGLKGSRANYWVSNGLDGVDSNLYYRRITVNAIIGVEKQLNKYFGFTAEVGATKPLRSGLYSFDTDWNRQHDFGEGISPYANVGLYLSINKSSL